MAKTKAKTKAKTVKVKVAVIYNAKGRYQAGGGRVSGKHPSDANLIDDAKDAAYLDADGLPHACIVDIELPIPEPLVGKVVKVEAVKL